MSQMPADAPLSEDRQWWWDGTQWQPVPEPHAIDGVKVQHGVTPHEIEMPPDGDFNRGSYPVADDAQVRSALLTALQMRLHEHQTQVLTAVIAFNEGAQSHIDNLSDGTSDFDFGPVVGALTTAMGLIFPEAEGAKVALEIFKTLVELESQAMDGYKRYVDTTLTDAKARLRNSLHALVQGYTDTSVHVWDRAKAQLPELVEDVLSDLDDKTMTVNPSFIDAVCDYAHIPAATGTYDTVRQQLEYEFFGTYERIRADLNNAQPGTEHASPIGWEHDAHVEEAKLYKRDDEKAWEEAYKE
jgi:hypothetical protein